MLSKRVLRPDDHAATRATTSSDNTGTRSTVTSEKDPGHTKAWDGHSMGRLAVQVSPSLNSRATVRLAMRAEVWVASPEPAVGVFTTAGTSQGRLRRHS